jgi:hypothetical protein
MAGEGDARSSAELAVKDVSWSKVCAVAALANIPCRPCLIGDRWPSRLVATATENRLNIRRNLHASLAVRWAAVSERPIWLACDRLAAADLLGHVFACLPWIVVSIFCGHGGYAFLCAFVPAAKAAIGSL